MNDNMDEFVLKILKVCPPLASDNTENINSWFWMIKQNLSVDVRQSPLLIERLMWIWLSQMKRITIQNLESSK